MQKDIQLYDPSCQDLVGKAAARQQDAKLPKVAERLFANLQFDLLRREKIGKVGFCPEMTQTREMRRVR